MYHMLTLLICNNKVGHLLSDLCQICRDGSKHMLTWRSLGARLALGIFEGACAWVLKSEHMLGSLVLGLDARRVLGEHQRITK